MEQKPLFFYKGFCTEDFLGREEGVAVIGDEDEVTSQSTSLVLDSFAVSTSGSQLLFRGFTFHFSVPLLSFSFSWEVQGSHSNLAAILHFPCDGSGRASLATAFARAFFSCKNVLRNRIASRHCPACKDLQRSLQERMVPAPWLHCKPCCLMTQGPLQGY